MKDIKFIWKNIYTKEKEHKDKFKQEFERDKVQMNNFYNAIEQYCNKLEEIAAKYQQTEARNVNAIRSH